MSQLQPYRQMLEAVSQSSTALVQLGQRTDVQVAEHVLWQFEILLETIVQDGFDVALVQSEKDSELRIALLNTRHHYDFAQNIRDWVVGWRNQCFRIGRLSVVIAADAWLLSHSIPHLALLNRPQEALKYLWGQSLSASLNTLSFCSEGLLTGDASGNIQLYNTLTGGLLMTHKAEGPIQMVCMAERDFFVYSTNKLTSLWKGKRRWRVAASTAAAFSDDMSCVLLGDARGRVLVFDVRSGEALLVTSVQGRVLQIVVWDEVAYICTTLGELWTLCLNTEECLRMKPPLVDVGSMDFWSAEGQLAVGSTTGELAIWDCCEQAWSKSHRVASEGLAFLYWQGPYSLIGGTEQGYCMVWDRITGQSHSMCDLNAPSGMMTYSAETKMLALGYGSHIYTVHPHQQQSFSGGLTIRQLAVSDDGITLGYILSDGTFRRVDIYAQHSYPSVQIPGQVLAVRPHMKHSTLSLRDGSRWEQIGDILQATSPSEDWIRVAAYGSDGAWAHILMDGSVELSFGSDVYVFEPPTPACRIAFSQGTAKLAVGLARGGIWIIEGETGQTHMLNEGLGSSVDLMVFSRDNAWLLVGDISSTLGLWCCETSRWHWRLRWPRQVCWAAFSSDTRFVYAVNTQEIVVLDRHLGKVIGRYQMVEPINGMVTLTGDRVCLSTGKSLHFFQWRQPERRLC